MQASSIPPKFLAAWANAAGSQYVTANIPLASQQSSGTPNAASYADGFPPDTFVAPGAGGIGPQGQDFNGILQILTRWAMWSQGGGLVAYDSAFATAIGGYAAGAVLASSATTGLLWVNLVDNNLTNPDGSNSSGWQSLFTGLATTAQITAVQGALNNEAQARAQGDALIPARLFTVVQDVTAQRSLGTEAQTGYQNLTGRPMHLSVIAVSTGALANLVMTVDGHGVAQFGTQQSGTECFVNGIVPNGGTYAVYNTVAGMSLQTWIEQT